MHPILESRKSVISGGALLIAALTAWSLGVSPAVQDDATVSTIVQAESTEAAAEAVLAVGGTVARELGIIRGVSAELTPTQMSALDHRDGVHRVLENRSVQVAGKPSKPGSGGKDDPGSNFLDTDYPTLIDADRLHADAVTGRGVTVAVVDTGYWPLGDIDKDSDGKVKLLMKHDARIKSKGAFSHEDKSGHASHVTSIIASSGRDADGLFNGVAPDANLVLVKAFDENGNGTYADVISALDYVYDNRTVFDIRVVNLSFSAPPQSYYWDDPINQAVMRLWEAGIVVVASAGNTGPDAMTIGVPGNVPYVITTGAMTDNYTPGDGSDDKLASFSSAGPTVEGFVKPEIVAPGGHLLGLMEPSWAKIAAEHPEFHDGWRGFRMSGTSQAAGVVTGVVALMLQREPFLTPDGVKCKLMSAARPAVNDDGSLAYSIFQQGAGLVNAYDAVYATDLTCANRGLDIGKDLAGEAHYGGQASRDESGSYYVTSPGDDYAWNNVFPFADAFLFSDAFVWSDVFIWSDAFLFADTYPWDDEYTFTDGFVFTDIAAESSSINVWVDQE